MQSLPTVSFIIPQLGREAGLKRCLDSINAQTYPASKREIVIIEGDEETVPQKVAKGLAMTSGEYVCFAANDMTFEPDAVMLAVTASMELGKGLVSFNEGPLLDDKGNICTHFVIRRSLVEKIGGEIFSTKLHHVGADNLLWAQCDKLGEAHYCEAAKINHRHFSRGGTFDEVYEKGWKHTEADRKKLAELLSQLMAAVVEVKKPKIAIYAIAKNEAQFAKRWAESCKDADYRIVCDTGSDDGTTAALQDAGVTVFPINVNPWRFDDARNVSLALVPADADICIALDMDEVMKDGWRETLEKAWKPGTTRLRYKFVWSYDDNGIPRHYFWGEKIHKRNGYRWHHPCHERVIADRIEEKLEWCRDLEIGHYPDKSKPRGQYLSLLAMSVKEDPSCPRNAFYYGRELMYAGKKREAVEALKRYLDMPQEPWPEERAMAMRFIANSVNDPKVELHWILRAVAEAPGSRESWVELASALYYRKDWAGCYAAAKSAVALTNRPMSYVCNPEAWGYRAYDFLSVAAWNIGLREESLANAKIAASFDPSNERLANNVKVIESILAKAANRGAA